MSVCSGVTRNAQMFSGTCSVQEVSINSSSSSRSLVSISPVLSSRWAGAGAYHSAHHAEFLGSASIMASHDVATYGWWRRTGNVGGKKRKGGAGAAAPYVAYQHGGAAAAHSSIAKARCKRNQRKSINEIINMKAKMKTIADMWRRNEMKEINIINRK